jgi:hypothetical protein
LVDRRPVLLAPLKTTTGETAMPAARLAAASPIPIAGRAKGAPRSQALRPRLLRAGRAAVRRKHRRREPCCRASSGNAAAVWVAPAAAGPCHEGGSHGALLERRQG